MRQVKNNFFNRTNLFAAAMIAASFIASYLTMRGDSGTVDEIAHIPSGYTYLTYHDYRLNPEHPPLLKEIAAFPLVFQNLSFDTNLRDYKELANGQWESGWSFLYRVGNNPDQILFWSRLPLLILFVIFAVSVFVIARKYYGEKVALLSLFLFAFSPTITGHNHYVTTDMGSAFFILISIYYFVRYLKQPTRSTTVWSGICIGLAQLAKYSAVLLFPLFVILLMIQILSPRTKLGDKPTSFLRKLRVYTGSFIVSLVIGYILVGVVYGLTMYATPSDTLAQLITASLPGEGMTSLRNLLLTLHDIPIAKYYAQYFLGLFMVFARVAGGNTTFLLGEVTNQSFFWYFPVAFLAKEMVGFIALLGIATLVVVRNNLQYLLRLIGIKKHTTATLVKNFWFFFENNILSFAFLTFIAIYMFFTLRSNLNIGIRHIIPILPMLYILVARASISWVEASKVKKGLLGIMCIWIVAAYAFAYPHYLAYFNELAGGRYNGYQILTDSNLDWGQDLKRLASWIDARGIEHIKLDYFGGGVPEYYLGDTYERWTSRYGPTNGWIAVSATYLQNSRWYHLQNGEPDYDWLREKEPVANIGGSILVYFIDTY